MLATPLEVRFAPLGEVIHRRILPVPGEVLVRAGDTVQAEDVVARASIEGALEAVDVAGALGVSVRSLARHLLVREGQHVPKGEPLAQVRRLWKPTQVKAPFAGTVQALIEGRLFLRQQPALLKLHAHLPGQIVEQYPYRGVAVCARGSLIRGIWGAGPETRGILAVMVSAPEAVLAWEHVGLRYGGTILVGGTVSDSRVLLRARAFGLAGLVVGSLAPGLCSLCHELSLPIVVTEGLGTLPMAKPVFDLLCAKHGRLAMIVGGDHHGSAAPELFVPAPAGSQRPSAIAMVRPIAVGMRVRITRLPYLGAIGQVIKLLPTPQRTELGTYAECAQVRLPTGRRVLVPSANMELFG